MLRILQMQPSRVFSSKEDFTINIEEPRELSSLTNIAEHSFIKRINSALSNKAIIGSLQEVKWTN